MKGPVSIAQNLLKRIKKCKCGNEIKGINKIFFCSHDEPYEDGELVMEYWIHCNKCGMETARYDNAVAAVTAWNGGDVKHWKDQCINNLLAILEARDKNHDGNGNKISSTNYGNIRRRFRGHIGICGGHGFRREIFYGGLTMKTFEVTVKHTKIPARTVTPVMAENADEAKAYVFNDLIHRHYKREDFVIEKVTEVEDE